MNVTVFGATGGVGSQVVDQLRSRGHTVTAYVRNPGKVPGTWGEDVAVVVGELSDAAAIDRTVQGADAVVSALGPKPVPDGGRAAANRGHPQHRGRDAAARRTPLRRQRHP